MATSTPNYGLIKPAGGEQVNINQINTNMDVIDTKLKLGDDAKQAVDAISSGNSGWVNINVSSGFVGLTGGEVPQAKKYNGFVCLTGGVSNTGMTTNNNHLVAKIPSSIPFPKDNIAIALGSSGNNLALVLFASQDGAIYVRTGTALPSYIKFAGISYPIL